MGRCVRCGQPMPGDVYGAVCSNCKRKEESERMRASHIEAQKNKQAAERARAEERAMDWRTYTDKFGNKVRVSGKTGDFQVKMFFWGWMGSSYKGNIEIRYPNGDLYVGGVHGSLYHGKGKITWKETGNSYEGDWVYHHKTGKGKYTWANGAYYEGDFVDGNFNGYGIRVYSDGYRYEGQFKDDKRHGKGVLTSPDGTAVEYYYENDKIVRNIAESSAPTPPKTTAKPRAEKKASVATGVTKKVASAPAVEKVTESDADIWNKLLGMTKAEKDAHFAQNPVLVVPKGIKKIPAACFEKCMNLKEIRFNAELRTIEQSAFASCENIGPELIIPEKVETISPYAFSGCTSIKTLHLPDYISIESKAFFACHIQDIRFQSDRPHGVALKAGSFSLCGDYMSKETKKKVKDLGSYALKN